MRVISRTNDGYECFKHIVANRKKTKVKSMVALHWEKYFQHISTNEIFEEMEAILGTDLYIFLSNTHKAILSTAFIFATIVFYLQVKSINMQDLKDIEKSSTSFLPNIIQ